MHLLTNAKMALLIEDAEAEAAQEQQPARVRGRLKRRDSAVLRGEKLTEEQITQVHPTRQLLAQPASCCMRQATTCIRHPCNSGSRGCSALMTVAVAVLQIHERIAQEIDPDGAGLSYSDFESITSRMPDFFVNFKMSV